jgi:hypothetical protein
MPVKGSRERSSVAKNSAKSKENSNSKSKAKRTEKASNAKVTKDKPRRDVQIQTASATPNQASKNTNSVDQYDGSASTSASKNQEWPTLEEVKEHNNDVMNATGITEPQQKTLDETVKTLSDNGFRLHDAGVWSFPNQDPALQMYANRMSDKGEGKYDVADQHLALYESGALLNNTRSGQLQPDGALAEPLKEENTFTYPSGDKVSVESSKGFPSYDGGFAPPEWWEFWRSGPK